jgi:hypothetical protein
VSTDGAEPAAIVSTAAESYADWNPDGRSLWYVEGLVAGLDDPQRRSDTGWLTEREVLDADGHIALTESALRVHLTFLTTSRVRSLPNGILIFNARELRLPSLVPDAPVADRDQLFAFDPAQATLTPLVPSDQIEQVPRSLDSFEPGPDPGYVLIGGAEGDVLLMRIRDGHVARFATGSKETDWIPMPSWRQPGEFVYLRKTASGTELVLRRGDTERVLSAGWPADTLTVKPKHHWKIEVSRSGETGER